MLELESFKIEDIKVAQFEKVFSTNVIGLTMLTQEVVKFSKLNNTELLLILALLQLIMDSPPALFTALLNLH